MRIAGAYVGLGQGDSSEEVRAIKAHMRRKFSYCRHLADTTVCDDQMTAAVADMQARYKSAGTLTNYTPGIINYATKVAMGWVKPPPPVDTRPVLFTVCGTGVPWWVGPDADVARAVEDRYLWQPVGYSAQPFPMNRSVQEGVMELQRQMEKHRSRITSHGCAIVGYSQGALVCCETWLRHIRDGGGLHWVKPHLTRAVMFGNPMREQGVAHTDGVAATPRHEAHGIADTLMTDTPLWWREYAHRGDLYTDVEKESGENQTAIYKIVMGARIFSGPDSLLRQILELTGVGDASRIIETTAMVKAVLEAGLFYAKRTAPHTNYGTGAAIQYLRS